LDKNSPVSTSPYLLNPRPYSPTNYCAHGDFAAAPSISVGGAGTSGAIDKVGFRDRRSLKCTLAGDNPYVTINNFFTYPGADGTYRWVVLRFMYKSDESCTFGFLTNNGPAGQFTTVAKDDWRVLFCSSPALPSGTAVSYLKFYLKGKGLSPHHLWIDKVKLYFFKTKSEADAWIG
jgi:hypothetical protein